MEKIEESRILVGFECKETDIPLVYNCLEYDFKEDRPTIVCITGTSGSGKDSVMRPLVEDGTLVHAVTATSRKRRYKCTQENEKEVKDRIAKCVDLDSYNKCLEELEKGGVVFDVEPENCYVWMRWRREDETEDEYFENLVKEYELVEYDSHYGNFYGLPKSSVEKALNFGIPLIRTDISGIESIRELFGDEYNILVFAIIPDSWEQIESAIREREGGENLEEVIKTRIEEDRRNIQRFQYVVNFVLHNTRDVVGDIQGLAYSISILRSMICKMTNQEV